MIFPLVHNGDGAFVWPGTEVEEIAASIRVILTILPGQHPRLPDLGNHAALLVFRNPGPGLEERIAALVKYDIETWEPRAQVESVEPVYDETTSSYRVGGHVVPANLAQFRTASRLHLEPGGGLTMARTYAEIVAELRQRARGRWPAWNQTAEHLGNIILDCEADQIEKLEYEIDAMLDDVMPDTTSSYARLLQWARLLGYPVVSAHPAEATLKFTVAEAAARTITIPAGTRVITAGPDPVVFTTLSTVQIAVGQTEITVLARQIEARTDTFTATGEPYQIYGTPSGPVWLDGLHVHVAGIDWVKVVDFLESDNAGHHFVASLQEDGSVWVEFGDGLRGLAPGAGQQVEISYPVTRGAVGNVEAGTLVVVDSAIYDAAGYLADVSVTNEAAAEGGQDQEDMNHIRDSLPRWVTTATRCVTGPDFQAAAESVIGVQRVLALTHEEDETIPALTILLYVLPVGGGAPGQTVLDAVLEEVTVNRPKIATLVVDVQAVKYETINVTVAITKAAAYESAAIQAAVEEAIADFFDYAREEGEALAIDWGKPIYKAKLSAWLFNVPGVVNVDLTAPAADVTPAADEIPALGTVSVSVS